MRWATVRCYTTRRTTCTSRRCPSVSRGRFAILTLPSLLRFILREPSRGAVPRQLPLSSRRLLQAVQHAARGAHRSRRARGLGRRVQEWHQHAPTATAGHVQRDVIVGVQNPYTTDGYGWTSAVFSVTSCAMFSTQRKLKTPTVKRTAVRAPPPALSLVRPPQGTARTGVRHVDQTDRQIHH